jgi:subtilisin family serine protease
MKQNMHRLSRFATLHRAVAATLGLCSAFVGAASFAVTVEFKLAPDLKGREYRQTISSIAEMGKVSTVGQSGNFKIETDSDAAAQNVTRMLREKRAVLWASVPHAPAATPNLADTAPEFDARIVAFELKAGSDAAVVVERIASTTGQQLRLKRMSGNNRALVVMPLGTSSANMAATMVAAQNDSAVISAQRVRLASHQWLPNDALFTQQWALNNGVGGIRAYQAWDITPSGSVQIAVIDTGIRSHPDLDGKRVVGYDMITEEFISVDGDGRDSDPSDPGDTDAALECTGDVASSWHGTHVAGIAAATANNAEGMSGVAPNSRVQSIRALGRCGGTEDDVADSIRWASGVAVPGAPANPMPSRILNLSLGANRAGPCSSNMQSAVDAAIAKSAIVVAAAGNSADVADYWPANCRGVISVASNSFLGDRSSFSNFGGTVAISAPGGENSVAGSPGVLSTLNGGTTLAGAPSYAVYSGTSMASPHAAGVVALMLARDPSLTSGQVLNRLQSSVRSFPVGSDCASVVGACGKGLLDAANAVAAVGINRGVNELAPSADRLHLVELVNSITGRYMLSADPTEVVRFASGGIWRRTGEVISTFSFTKSYGAGSSVSQPVCRAMVNNSDGFVYSADAPSNNRGAFVYSANEQECKNYQRPGSGFTPHGVVFAGVLPNAGTCPTGSEPVWDMVKNDSLGVNVRNVANTTEISNLLTQGWAYSRIAFCKPL